jgi:ribonuclease BN (tRNA processing enzyme)
MRLTFLGTGSAMPVPDRHQTGFLLRHGGGSDGDADDGRPLLVDCGAGVLHRLAGTEPGYEGVSSVLLSHHHLDHVADLLPLVKARWLAGADHLEVVGPPGTKALVDDLLSVHDYLEGRIDLRVREVTPDESFAVAGFDVRSFETRHSMQCLAYRVADGTAAASADAGTADGDAGHEVVLGGDSEAFRGLTGFADGAAALVHDCSFPDDVDVSNHPTPTQLGEALASRSIGRVYLSHLYPHTEGRHEEMLASIGERYDGDVRFARDGLTIEV